VRSNRRRKRRLPTLALKRPDVCTAKYGTGVVVPSLKLIITDGGLVEVAIIGWAGSGGRGAVVFSFRVFGVFASGAYSPSLRSDRVSPNSAVSICSVVVLCAGRWLMVGRLVTTLFARRGGGGGVSIRACNFRLLEAVDRCIRVPTLGTRRLVVVPAPVGVAFIVGPPLFVSVIDPRGRVASFGRVAMACSHSSSNSSSRPSMVGLVLNSASRTRSILTLNFLPRVA